jgi:hypothetical protein
LQSIRTIEETKNSDQRENLEEDDFNEIRLNLPEVLLTFSFGNESSIYTIIEENKDEG